MNSKPIEHNPNPAVNEVSELVFDADELGQLAKFLDALLEADLANQSDEGNGSD